MQLLTNISYPKCLKLEHFFLHILFPIPFNHPKPKQNFASLLKKQENIQRYKSNNKRSYHHKIQTIQKQLQNWIIFGQINGSLQNLKYYKMKTRSKNMKSGKYNEQIDEGIPSGEILSANKNIRKSMKKTAKDLEPKKDKGQKKLTSYFEIDTTHLSQETVPELVENKTNQLKNQLKEQEERMEKMKIQKQIIESKYSKLYLEAKSYKNKAKQIIIKNMREKAAIERKQRGIVDEKLGYYGSRKQFILGTYFIQINKQISEKETQLQELQKQLQKIKPTSEQHSKLKYKLHYLKKEIKGLFEKIDRKEGELTQYKERLKLHMNESNCTYADKNWPIIKDSNGIERYLTLQLLGKGGFGEVYKCFDIQNNEYVAIKKVNINQTDVEYREQTLKHVTRQIHTQKKLKHPNIAEIKQILQISLHNIEFVMEYCPGRDLGVQLRQEKCFEEKYAKNIIRQLFDALAYLTSLDPLVIHYDLKPSNIIHHYGIIKILDFGLCKLMDNEHSRMMLTSQGVGTYWYLPPEAFIEFDPQISAKLDVWSAGVIFFQLLYGARPFANGVPQKTIFKHDLISKQSKKLTFPSETSKMYPVSEQAKQFIKKCLKYQPQERITASKAFKDEYLKST